DYGGLYGSASNLGDALLAGGERYRPQRVGHITFAVNHSQSGAPIRRYGHLDFRAANRAGHRRGAQLGFLGLVPPEEKGRAGFKFEPGLATQDAWRLDFIG